MALAARAVRLLQLYDLTSLGYGDVTPTRAPTSRSLAEVMFGGFYMAIVVAQLVGLKLAQAPGSTGPARDDSHLSWLARA